MKKKISILSLFTIINKTPFNKINVNILPKEGKINKFYLWESLLHGDTGGYFHINI